MSAERHTLYHRPIMSDAPKKVRVFGTYNAALKAGMRECERGTFWIDSEKRSDGAARWTEFCPVIPRLRDMEMDELKEMIE